MTKIVAVYSMKGGVGKTTLAVNLAYCSASHSSRRTLLWDIDAQGASSFLFGQERPLSKASRVFSREVEPSALVEPTRWPRLDLLAADMSLRHLETTFSDLEKPKRLRKLVQTLAPAYDRIILDCPPGLGEISDQLFRAVDIIIVPVAPTPLALRSLALQSALWFQHSCVHTLLCRCCAHTYSRRNVTDILSSYRFALSVGPPRRTTTVPRNDRHPHQLAPGRAPQARRERRHVR